MVAGPGSAGSPARPVATFALPPAEVAVHPADGPARHELYLMCDDLDATMAELGARGVVCGPVAEQRRGRLTSLGLPGGAELGLYEPRHPMAVSPLPG
ncbi:MAG TPA: hypothetical protein VHL53_09855 [Acidimicrobiia bacterium]|nr:hypothetical protein [Acidimicrobiia bacterium]